jgi:hypothetical protein
LSTLIHGFFCGKRLPKIWATTVTFHETVHRKQLSNRRKFAQAGHPVSEQETLTQQIEKIYLILLPGTVAIIFKIFSQKHFGKI